MDRLRQEVEILLKQEAENPNFRLEKRMEVCQTCGAFLIVGDQQKRIESHFEGRQHTGWARVRQTLSEHKASRSHDYARATRARSRSPPPSSAHHHRYADRAPREPGQIYEGQRDLTGGSQYHHFDSRDRYRQQQSSEYRRR